ncbi:MAG: ATPase [Alphaproteobacteria bacterium]|nr:ATPase [Alphaproteobacteria bacterium]
MTRLAETTAHIASMNELLDIVGAMRSLAGMRMQEAQRALPGVRHYATTLTNAIVDTPVPLHIAASAPRASAGQAIVLCTSEHGFVGGFNERMLAAIEPRPDALFVLGTRGAALAGERGMKPDWIHAMATRVAAVAEAVDRLTTELYRRIADGTIGRVDVVFANYRQAGASSIERRALFPIDPSSFGVSKRRQTPLFNLVPEKLREKLVAEYVVALLTEAAVESLASENAARFAAMESAHENVAKKLDDLQRQARLMRQSEITAELLELVTGAEALA